MRKRRRHRGSRCRRIIRCRCRGRAPPLKLDQANDGVEGMRHESPARNGPRRFPSRPWPRGRQRRFRFPPLPRMSAAGACGAWQRAGASGTIRRPFADGNERGDIAARPHRGQAGDRSGPQEPPGRSDQRRGHHCRSARAQARRMGDPAQRRRHATISRVMPPSSPPIRAGRASRLCGAGPKACCGRNAPIRKPSSAFSPPNRRTPPKDISRWRARCWRKATVPAPPRRCATPGATTAFPPISKRRRATLSPA